MKDIMSEAMGGFWSQSSPSKKSKKMNKSVGFSLASLDVLDEEKYRYRTPKVAQKPNYTSQKLALEKARLKEMQLRLQRQKIAAQYAAINAERNAAFWKTLGKGARFLGESTASAARAATPYIRSAAKATSKATKEAAERIVATPAYKDATKRLTTAIAKNKYVTKAGKFYTTNLRDTRYDKAALEKAEREKPVGLGGAIYAANKAAGRKSIYD